MEFHHAGIAAEDGAATAALFADLFDTEVVHEESLDDLDVVFLEVGDGLLEILEPTADGTVARFVDREGPGIHHLAFATDDLPGAIEHARSLGIEPIDEEPRPGAAGHDVAFLHPRDTAGVLVEFVSE
ncbi:methylmalonyl-CoA epimerase [Salinarchaeum sp. Harcht-Bsk1]|uniref:methylmalonyl-CoA epimerase n=1 Tax=Salinarchaeum sp. Harcht-Bsk1 TaxID=1333523 RepID=UPI000342419E|nr:methylmalonyl-CoA epimerase [Salinarchaeum sp. Harcht-Bsk1]AGN00483.1 methylmalonyl-CoA epimerase [Salinarchaeum sp. Harcht-Bsk1]